MAGLRATLSGQMPERARIRVTGIVQGVGFRPHVYNLAVTGGLSGFVLNTSRGVTIEVEGPGAETFAERLRQDHPPLSIIKTIETEILEPAGYSGFEIRLSESVSEEFSLISPDIPTCPDCLKELYNHSDRRYLYPFINCTNCGPRYSIIKCVPYDRPFTTMAAFRMCPQCYAEYHDPADRRFHAQPTACPQCGPKVGFTGGIPANEAVISTIRSIMSGNIVAVKGLGGYQLACDAYNEGAVNKLRDRKRKSRKPFALMARDIDTIKKYCAVSPAEESLLTGRAAPIVLLKKKEDAADMLPEGVAPGNRYIGFMLPYTPLHHILFRYPEATAEDLPEVLVMTSGNISEEPIVIDNTEASEKLSGLADAFLTHDRGIYMRVDDSVTRVVSGIPRLIRRARGFVPEPIELATAVPDILACGGELKNTLCLTKDRYAIISQHIGDLSNYEAMGFFEETLNNLKRTFKAEPHIVAHDMHPDYLSTRFAQTYKTGDDNNVTLVPVQHHHAHIASCMAENGETGRVIGVAFDGTGYGLDGNSWGSEFLITGYEGFERFAHLNYIPLPGGDKAVKEPWRLALSILYQTYGQEAFNLFSSLKPYISVEETRVVLTMLEKNFNSPLSCGMGRLFDAVSSLIGICDKITFEGEAAIALEMAFADTDELYPYYLEDSSPIVINVMPLVRAIVVDIRVGVAASTVAGKFHNTVAAMVFEVCALARDNTRLETVALSGGVFQNALLFGLVESGLKARGFRVLSHSKVPTNDACISLGQAAVAAARASEKSL